MNTMNPNAGMDNNKIGSTRPQPQALSINKVDNGFLVIDHSTSYHPLQKVAVSFDGMVDILKEHFNEITPQ